MQSPTEKLSILPVRALLLLDNLHDELNFSVLPEEHDRVQRIVIEEMGGKILLWKE